jgi:hypothetical protein
VVAAFGALLLLMGLADSTSFTPGAEGYVVASGVLMIAAGVVLGITHALTAAGVWWGQRREAAKVGSSESSLSGDASPEAML